MTIKQTLKILWAVDGYQFNGGGYGFSIHRLKMRQALAAAGITLCFDPKDDFDVAVHIVRPDYFRPISGKCNLLFTVCEMTEPTVDLSAHPDVLVVPCEHNKNVFAKHYPGPIEICAEGIDPALFPFYQRKEPEPGEPFRFLFFGNDFFGTRKGAGFIISAWNRWLQMGRMPQNCQLIIKTTGIPGPELQFYNAVNNEVRIDLGSLPASTPKLQGVVMDTRNLPVGELITLYGLAHAFVLPSCGEGWGLTLTEAMATGAPCIWTHWSAPLDYADESIGFPITDFKMIPFWRDGRGVGVGDPDYFGAAATETAIIQRMEQVYHGYDRALKLGKKASERMHARFKWSDAASAFINICEKYKQALPASK